MSVARVEGQRPAARVEKVAEVRSGCRALMPGEGPGADLSGHAAPRSDCRSSRKELSVCSPEEPQESKREPQPPRRAVSEVLAILWCIFWILVALGWILHGGEIPLPIRG